MSNEYREDSKKICPLMSSNKEYIVYCQKSDCGWYECAVEMCSILCLAQL